MTHVISLPPERQNAMTLRDGRTLSWYEWGAPDATPVIFCTGAAMSGYLGFGTDALAALGLRLIAPDRPGLGRSSLDPHKTLLSWVDDIRELCHARALNSVLTVGFSQGAPFALALAYSGLALAAAIVSGQDQLTHLRVRPQLHPDIAAMLDALEEDPEAFEQRIAQTATLDWLFNFVISTSAPIDRQLYENPTFSRDYYRSLEEGFSQGARGYARDLRVALSTWPFEIEEVSTPIDLWYGRKDTSTVHSPDFGATMAARLPQASLNLFSDEGGSILWTRAAEILGRLAKHASEFVPGNGTTTAFKTR